MDLFRPGIIERIIPVDRTAGELDREWLVTNGIGGYASGTIAGINTRRFHGWLIAALPTPHGRTMMLNQLDESFSSEQQSFKLTAENLAYATQTDTVSPFLSSFRLENGLPIFTYASKDFELEKRVCMVHAQNTTYITYRLLRGKGTLTVRPGIQVRRHEGILSESMNENYRFTSMRKGFELAVDPTIPPLRLTWVGEGTSFQLALEQFSDLRYRIEQDRGYDWQGNLWSPGTFSVEMSQDQAKSRVGAVSLIASTEEWDHIEAFTPETAFLAEDERRRRLLRVATDTLSAGFGGELTLAADQFLITPVGRIAEAVQSRAIGDEVRAVIAGYHWFTDWGRDTMISLEGLTLSTGRVREAEYILRSFAKYVSSGLIPNMFPEGTTSGLYHTADASLWYFHAANRYVRATEDIETLEVLLPKMLEIIDFHRKGTFFGIGIDAEDHLLRQGEEGFQLTWMDAKVDDWVVTPRRGKAVEINALWYNALCIMSEWMKFADDSARSDEFREKAEAVRMSFNARFWNEKAGYCFDVIDTDRERWVDGRDPSLRPNQLFAISLDYPVLESSRWPAVLATVREQLLTPVGLRSLGPKEPDYRARYDGDLRSRDAAYHQGTVWAWLIGPFIDAWLKAYPTDLETARSFLEGFDRHMSDAGIGTISEVFDAEPPFLPRGCIAQAWSVAEVLRCELKLRQGTT